MKSRLRSLARLNPLDPAPRIRVLFVLFASFALLGQSCEVDQTDPKVRDTVLEINATFQAEYRRILDDIGTRHYDDIAAEPAMDLIQQVLEGMQMKTINREGGYYLHVSSPAPLPLSESEWREVVSIDEPTFKRIASKHMGMKGNFAKLEPEGLVIDGIITVLEARGGVDISITMRMRETRPQDPESILPRRDYAPPSAVRLGFEKIWRDFEGRLPMLDMAR